MKNEDVLLKEIDLIQSCINRMAQNSFIVKGWTISLVAVVLALLPDIVNIKLLCALCVVFCICFWYLDAFFLKTERLYRWKYEWITTNRLKCNDYFYDLNPKNQNMWCNDANGNPKKEPCILRIMFTKTLIPVYATLIVLSIIIFVLSFWICF